MRNIAKCRLCSTVIESFHPDDYVACKCDEIAVDGGLSMKCFAKDFANFVRIDDMGNEIVVKVNNVGDADVTKPNIDADAPVMTKADKLMMLDEMIKAYDNLPQHALHAPVTHSDLLSVLMLVSSILRA